MVCVSTMGSKDHLPGEARAKIPPKQHRPPQGFSNPCCSCFFAVPLYTPGSKAGTVLSTVCQTAESVSRATQSDSEAK